MLELNAGFFYLLDNVINDILDHKSRSMFIETDNPNSTTTIIQYIKSKENNSVEMVGYYPEERRIDPYYPLLQLFRERQDENERDSVNALIEQLQVYSFHREIVSNYILDGHATRREDIICEEVEFEQDMMRQNVSSMLESLIADRAIILVIANIEMLPTSTMKWLNWFINEKRSMPLLLIMTGMKNNKFQSRIRQDVYNSLIKTIDSNSILVQLTAEIHVYVPGSINEPQPEKGLDVDSVLLAAENSNRFLCFEDSEALLTFYRQSILLEGDKRPEILYQFYHHLGDALFFQHNYDSAILIYNNLLNHANQQNNTLEIAIANYKMGLIYVFRDDIVQAERCANKSLTLTDQYDDQKLLYYTYLLLFQIENRGRKQSISKFRHSYYNVLQLAEKLEMENTLAYLLTNPYGTYSQYSEEFHTLHDRGIELATKNGNIFRLASAYQTKGLIYAVKGDIGKVLYYYKKSEKLKLQIGNILELSYINNGLGFYYYLIGSYRKAHRYYERALGYLKQIKDYHEIGQTLFNIGSNFLLGSNYKAATQVFEKMIWLLQTSGLHNFSYHSRYGVFCIMAVAYFKNGQFNKSMEYWLKIESENLKPFPGKNEEYFYGSLLEALINMYNGNWDKAETFFQRCILYLDKKNDVIKYLAPRFWLEYTLFYMTIRNKTGLNYAIEKGMEVSDEMGYPSYLAAFKSLAEGQLKELELFTRNAENLDVDWIIESSHLESRLTTLYRKIDEINFLFSFQSLLTTQDTVTDLIMQSLRLICTSFLFNSAICHYVKSDDRDIRYTRSFGFDGLEDKESTVYNLIRGIENRHGNSVNPGVNESDNLSNPEHTEYSYYIYMPLIRNNEWCGFVACFSRDDTHYLKSDDVQVLFIAGNQLATALYKIEQDHVLVEKNEELNEANSKLLLAATTDMMTGVANRTELHRKMEEERKRLLRYHSEGDTTFSVLFIDLDNFKYYNDNYGHVAGDTILVEFSRLLKTLLREEDFVARYGGDEFVVLLTSTNLAGAEQFANRIFRELENQAFFAREVETALSHPISVGEGNRIGCSIGIAQFNGTDTVDELIRKADLSLYKAKDDGKNRFKTFQERKAN